MAEPDKTCHDGRTSRFKPRPNGCTGEAVDREGLITREEFMQKILEEGATYQRLLNPTPQ